MRWILVFTFAMRATAIASFAAKCGSCLLLRSLLDGALSMFLFFCAALGTKEGRGVHFSSRHAVEGEERC